MMDQMDEFTKGRPPNEINNTSQSRMDILGPPCLNEEDASSEMIDDGLKPSLLPPLHGVVPFSASYNYPVR